jgi:hypothetical protein
VSLFSFQNLLQLTKTQMKSPGLTTMAVIRASVTTAGSDAEEDDELLSRAGMDKAGGRSSGLTSEWNEILFSSLANPIPDRMLGEALLYIESEFMLDRKT